MSLIICQRRFRIDAGHRVYGHESKCANVHGHSYEIFVTAQAPSLDSIGRVIDFSVIKSLVGEWLERYWDHGMILFKDDPIVDVWRTELTNHKLYLMPYNPTAENMAKFLLEEVCPSLFEGTVISISSIEVRETENCFARATED